MRTTSTTKKSTKVRASTVRQKARTAVQRVSVADVRHLPKPRVGFEELVPTLLKIVEKYGPALGAGFDVEILRSSMAAYEGLATRYRDAVDELAEVEGERTVQSSAAWVQILAIYEKARSLARYDKAVRGDIDPIAHFMKTGPRKPRNTAKPPVVTTTTTTP